MAKKNSFGITVLCATVWLASECLTGRGFSEAPTKELNYGNQGNWPATVNEIKKFLQLAPGQRPTSEELNLQIALMKAISGYYPLEFDWVIQDLGDNLDHIRDFYFRRTPEIEQKMLEKVFGDLGRDCPNVSRADFLATHQKAAAERRQRRLAGLKDHCRKVVFVKHFNLGGSHYAYTEALSDAQGERHFVPGGALCVYDVKTGKVETLLSDEDGVIRDPDVSFDGTRILFAWKKNDRDDDYHLYEMDYASREVRQITHGLGFADYEGIYLPGGDIIFSSTRCIQTTDCWTTEVSNIYRCDKDGRHLRRLGFDQVATNYPKLMSDGRVTYTRWEYMDRGQVYPQPLFQMNQDGTGQTEFYGNNSWFPTSILHARDIPASHKVMAVSSGHHTMQSGKLIEIDNTKGRQENVGVEYLNPRRPSRAVRIDGCDQHGTQYQYPYPLGARDALATISPGALRWVFRVNTNMCRRPPDKRSYDLYFINTETDARELLYRDPELSSSQPIPLRPRPAPHGRPSAVDYTRRDGAYYMQDVYVGPGLEGVPRGTIKRLRVIALDWRVANVGDNYNHGPTSVSRVSNPVSIQNGSWEPKYILGEAPIHEDGSAYFKVPARTPVFFQCIDEDGRAVQTMRSWSTLQPGELMGCVGCHENKNEAPAPDMRNAEAFRAGAVDLKPFYDIRRGFSFMKDIQPILDKHCVECHRPGGKCADYDLSDAPLDDPRAGRFWTRSYVTLTRHGHPNQYITWVHAQSLAPMIPPNNVGSAASPIFELLKDHYKVNLSREKLDKLAAWIDLAVPFSQGYIDQNAYDAKQMAQFEQFFNKREYCELLERRGIEALVREKQGAEDFRMPCPVLFDEPLAPAEIYRNILADEGVQREQGTVVPEAAAPAEAVPGKTEKDASVETESQPHYAWAAEFPAEMSFDRLDVILDAKSFEGAFPVAATLEFADGSTTQIAIEQQAARQSFYIERHDSESLKIRAPRRLAADFELFGRTKTGLFDREQNTERRKEMPKYTWRWNEMTNKYKDSWPPNLFQTLDQWRAERRKRQAEGEPPAESMTVVNLKATMEHFGEPVTLSWEGTTRLCEISRDGKVIAARHRGSAYADLDAPAGKKCIYKVKPIGSGTAATVAITTRQFDPNSPLPHVRITRLRPLKAVTGWRTLGIGKSVRGGPLSLSGKTYADGVGIHANGELVYARQPEWIRFVATAGIDDSQRSDPRASIVCQVIAEDAKGKQRTLAESPKLESGKQEQHHFDVPLPADCIKLHLIVDDADDDIHCDHADWVNAGFRTK